MVRIIVQDLDFVKGVECRVDKESIGRGGADENTCFGLALERLQNRWLLFNGRRSLPPAEVEEQLQGQTR
jgi:hypothetical protein